MRVTVLVRPKSGILDPQGEAIARSLAGLGLPVESVRAGKVFDLELALDDPAEARRVAIEAAEKALANDLIEGFEVVDG
jgi:phosphoribosylformylglycinamidine synthase subunit PurS